jgi:IclR family acetate operon transcriptional repressor
MEQYSKSERTGLTDSTKSSAQTSAKNLAKGLGILNLIAQHVDGLTLSEVSHLGGVPKATAHRLLSVLLEYGMLRASSDDKYLAGPQCLVLGNQFLSGLSLRQEAQDILHGLTRDTSETCHLGIKEGTRIVYIDKVESPHPVRMYSRIGATNPVHSTALGRAILAYCDEGAVEAVISSGLERRTPNTITDPERFRANLAEVKRRGFAVDDIENEEGIRCVAAPVFDHDGSVVAGISVSGPEQRIPAERLSDLGFKVAGSAFALSRRLGYAAEGKDVYRSVSC